MQIELCFPLEYGILSIYHGTELEISGKMPAVERETIPMVPDFEAKLSEYAHLLVEVGLNVQPGQTPSIESNVEIGRASCRERMSSPV